MRALRGAAVTVNVDARCELMDLPKVMCSHCRGLPWTPPRDAEVEDVGPIGRQPDRWFPAAYDGNCAGCGALFEAGEPLIRSGAGYVASCCNGETPWVERSQLPRLRSELADDD